MLDSLWIVLTLLQAPPPPVVPIGLPDNLVAITLPVGVTDIPSPPPVGPGLTAPAPASGDAPAPQAAVVQPPPAKKDAPAVKIVRGKAELSYVATGGTAETQTLGTAGEVLVTPARWRIETKLAYLRNRVDGDVRARRLTGQVRTARRIGERSELFGRAAYLRNTFAGISNSWDAAAGVTAILVQAEPMRLSLDSGFGYLTEDRTLGLGRDLASVDVGVRYLWNFSRTNRFTNDAAVKADIERTSDWRLNHVAALQAGLNSVLSFKVAHELNYRNEPVPGFTRADTVASAALVATF